VRFFRRYQKWFFVALLTMGLLRVVLARYSTQRASHQAAARNPVLHEEKKN
jgi:hypothetical protein